jgi:hypothetical protein
VDMGHTSQSNVGCSHILYLWNIVNNSIINKTYPLKPSGN